MTHTHYPKPTKRRLRVFAFDPAASVDLDTAVINAAVIALPWEKPWEDDLGIGPVNDYLEIVDFDSNFKYFFEPLDLNDAHLLAQDGLTPAEGNPQFHQQMVFAVAMKTIRNFEQALGRPVFWAQATDHPDAVTKRQGRKAPPYPAFVKRLRIYPHAMQEKNAYFSPAKAALMFGYFKGQPRFKNHQGDWVFTCLSQDIIAHETVHAILHGMRSRHIEAGNPDALAFHEGFADIVALFQHFTMQEVLAHQLGKSGGVLRSVSLLTGLANQFGEATGHNGPLRNAIDLLRQEQVKMDDTGAAKVRKLSGAIKPHDRGQFLVAAVFDAFITIYERRTADLFAIAGRRPGGDGDLPEKLILRLAAEAAKIAQNFLGICVRALDYLPPGTSTFGDYLRAMITADMELVPDDPHNYRVSLAESFRKREIPVDGCGSYAPIALAWQNPDTRDYLAKMHGNKSNISAMKKDERIALDQNGLFADALHRMKFFAQLNGESQANLMVSETDNSTSENTPYFDQPMASRNLRDEAMHVVSHNQRALYDWMQSPSPSLFQERMWELLLGIRTLPLEANIDHAACGDEFKSPLTIRSALYTSVPDAIQAMDSKWKKWMDEDRRLPILDNLAAIWTESLKGHDKPFHLPIFDVHSVRISRRTGPSGEELFQMIAQITQKRAGFFVKADQELYDTGKRQLWTGGSFGGENKRPDFWFRGGATIIVDLRNGSIQHVVRQRIDNDWRLDEQRAFILGNDTALAMTAMAMRDLESAASTPNADGIATKAASGPVTGWEGEPFAFIHGESE